MKVAQALRNLTADIDAPPVVSKADANADVILILSVQRETRSILELSDFAETVLAEQLQTIPEVSGVNIFGQRKYAMRIWFKPERMTAYDITISDVNQALTRENVELPGGKIYGSNTEMVVRTIGRLTTEEDFRNLLLREDERGLIRLSDIAEVNLGSEVEEIGFRLNGISSVACGVSPQPGANYINSYRIN